MRDIRTLAVYADPTGGYMVASMDGAGLLPVARNIHNLDNARLLAAAPEMLTALRETHGAMLRNGLNEMRCFSMVEAVLNRVEDASGR